MADPVQDYLARYDIEDADDPVTDYLRRFGGRADRERERERHRPTIRIDDPRPARRAARPAPTEPRPEPTFTGADAEETLYQVGRLFADTPAGIEAERERLARRAGAHRLPEVQIKARRARRPTLGIDMDRLVREATGTPEPEQEPLPEVPAFGRETYLAKQLLAGLSDVGLSTAAGVANIASLGRENAATRAIQNLREEAAEFYGEPLDLSGTIARLGGGFAGNMAQYAVTPAAVAGLLRGGALAAKTAGAYRAVKPLLKGEQAIKRLSALSTTRRPGLRGIAERTAAGGALGLPLDVAISQDPELNTAKVLAGLTGSERLAEAAGHPASRLAVEILAGNLIPGAAFEAGRAGVRRLARSEAGRAAREMASEGLDRARDFVPGLTTERLEPGQFPKNLVSRLEQKIDLSPAVKMQGRQWLAHLGKGVSQGELEWTGVKRMLEAEPERVFTRQEVRDQFDQNRIELEVTELERPKPRIPRTGVAMATQVGLQEIDTPQNLKFERWTEPGGTNYKEILIRLKRRPENPRLNKLVDEIKALGDEQERLEHQTYDYLAGRIDDDTVLRRRHEIADRRRARIAEWTALRESEHKQFMSEHWDQPNVLVHIRQNDRVAPNGEKVRYIEEIQSDWAQRARTEGVRQPVPPDEMAALEARVDETREELWREMVDAFLARSRTFTVSPEEVYPLRQIIDPPVRGTWDRRAEERADRAHPEAMAAARGAFNWLVNPEWALGMLPEASGRISAAREAAEALSAAKRRSREGVPDLPFKKTEDWVTLAWKKIIDDAIKDGVDRIAWTPGRVQADRYDLAHYISELQYRQLPADDVRRPRGVDEDWYEIVAFDRDGEEIADDAIPRGYPASQLERYFGKEVAEKILGDQGEPRVNRFDAAARARSGKPGEVRPTDWRSLHSGELAVGGEGMRRFYDQIVPNTVKKYAKSLGVMIEPEEIPVLKPRRADTLLIRPYDMAGMRPSIRVAPLREALERQGYRQPLWSGAAIEGAAFGEDDEGEPNVLPLALAALALGRRAKFRRVAPPAALTGEAVGRTAVKLLEHMKSNSGFTLNPHTGELLEVGKAQGYAMGVGSEMGGAVQADELTAELLTDFLTKNRALFATREGVMVGGWRDSETGKYVLEPSLVLTDRRLAAREAMRRGEKAIFDLQTGQDIDVRPVTFDHYTAAKEPIRRLLASKMGTGDPGAERARPDRVPGVYVYDRGAPPEPQFKNRPKYLVDVPAGQLYDIATDPDGIVAATRRRAPGNGTAIERAIERAGYDGYYDSGEYAQIKKLFGDWDTRPEDVERLPQSGFTAEQLSAMATYGPVTQSPEILAYFRQYLSGLVDKAMGRSREPGSYLPKRVPKRPVPAGSRTVEEIARILARGRRAATGELPAQIETAVRRGLPEALHALELSGGDNWYRADLARMDRALEEMVPTLRDPVHKKLFRLILAITSPQQRVTDNLKSALTLYFKFLRSGQDLRALTPYTGRPIPDPAHPGKFKRAQDPEVHGSYVMREWEAAFRKIEAYLGPNRAEWDEKLDRLVYEQVDRSYKPQKAKEAVVERVPLAMQVLSDKVGPFYANLMGAGHAVTVDLWAARTLRGWLGIPDAGEISEAEGVIMRRAVQIMATEASKDLKKFVDPMDLQAALWYYEQQRWRHLGLRSDYARQESYGDAAERLSRDPTALDRRTAGANARRRKTPLGGDAEEGGAGGGAPARIGPTDPGGDAGAAGAAAAGRSATAPADEVERVIGPVVRYRGKTYRGVWHQDARENAWLAGVPQDAVLSEGFETNKREYVSRAEAARIAKSQDQLKPVPQIASGPGGALEPVSNWGAHARDYDPDKLPRGRRTLDSPTGPKSVDEWLDERSSLSTEELRAGAKPRDVDFRHTGLRLFHGSNEQFDPTQFEVGRPTITVPIGGEGEVPVRNLAAFFTTDRRMAWPGTYRYEAELPATARVLNLTDRALNKYWDKLKEMFASVGYTGRFKDWRAFEDIYGGEEFVKALRKLGYDAVIMNEGDGRYRSVAVLDPKLLRWKGVERTRRGAADPPSKPRSAAAPPAPRKPRRGAADVRALGDIALAGTGALVGAAADDESPARGALVGAVIGYGGLRLAESAVRAATRGAQILGIPRANIPAHARGDSRIDYDGSKLRAWRRELKGNLHDRLQRIFDKMDAWRPIERLGTAAEGALRPTENPKHLLTRLRAADETIRTFINTGVLDYDTREVIGPSFRQVFEPLGPVPEMIQAGLRYAVHKRVLGRGLDAAAGDQDWLNDAAIIVRDLERNPQIVEFAKRLEAYIDGIGLYAVKSGLWTRAQWQAIRDADVLYIPFRRILDDFPVRIPGKAPSQRLANVTSGVKRFTGSRRAVENPAVALAEYTEAIIRRADQYAIGHAVFDAVDALGLEGEAILTRIDVPEKAPLDVHNARLALQAAGYDPATASAIADLHVPELSTHNPVIWRNKPQGGREYGIVQSKELWEALNTLRPEARDGVRHLLDLTLRPLKRVFTAAATGFNPRFAFGTNPARDVVDAWQKSQHGVRLVDMAKGYYAAIAGAQALPIAAGATAGATIGAVTSEEDRFAGARRGAAFGALAGGGVTRALGARSVPRGARQLMQQASRAGVGQTAITAQQVDVQQAARKFAPTTRMQRFRAAVQDITGAPLRFVEGVAETSDRAPRLAEYMAAARSKQHLVDQGKWTPADLRLYAATQARGATIDFSKKPGSTALRLLADYVPFFGVAIQAPLRYGRAWRESPKRMAVASTGVALAAVAAWALKERDEDTALKINDRPATERAAYLIVPMGEGTTLRIPMGQENGIIAAAVTAALDKLARDDPKAGKVLRESIKRALPPGIGETVPPVPVVQQIMEIERNRTEYGDRPIEPERLRDLPPAERRFDTTSPTFDALAAGARAIGFERTSPLQMEHIVRGVTSGFTPAVTALTDPLAERLGFAEAKSRVPLPASQEYLNPLSALVAREPPGRTESEGDYYAMRQRYREAEGTLRELRTMAQGLNPGDTAAMQELTAKAMAVKEQYAHLADERLGAIFDAVDRKVASLRTAEREVTERYRRGVIDDARARATLDELRRQRQLLMRRIVQVLSQPLPPDAGQNP